MASIAIYAPKSIVYVAGTVNDIDTVFHRNQDDGKWYGYAAVVDGGKYHLKIEMYDNAGNHSMYENTLYCDLPVFITDRTGDDLVLRTSKAYLNAADLNRIEKNAQLIGKMANLLVSAKTDWKVGNLPRSSDWIRICQNIETIRSYAHRRKTPETPSRPINHFEKVNDIEQILADAFDMYTRNQKNLNYAGETYAGEGGFF
jgi:hypothetical protein|nr:MAG TPA: hypothetical protein [Caudoviricetes sp.]